MYGVKFSLWLTGAIGPDCTSIGEFKNLDINYHLQSYVMDRSMGFFLI